MNDKCITAYAKGIMGEDRACKYLCLGGMVPLFQRYHSPFGELDLIMLDGDILVFVEVKTREHATVGDALNAVDKRKQERIINTARCFLGEHAELSKKMMRFDVVVVNRMGVTHVKNAFEGTEW